MYGLNNKVAVITGVGNVKGMGFAMAKRLADEGCRLVLADIVPIENIQATAAALKVSAAGVHCIRCDISNEEQVEAMIAEATAVFGSVDIVVNNAGVLRAKPFLEYTAADWDFMYSVMVKGTFLGTKYAAKQMLRQKSAGTVICMASMGGKRVFEGEAAYGSCKRAIVHMVQAAATELSPHGIRVNGIAPGDHWTDMLEKCFKEMAADQGTTVEALIKESESETPLRRLGTTQDIANLCAFLASEESSYITGQVINCNGGLYME